MTTQHKNKKRTYGTGGARPRHSGVTIRYREKVIQSDGTVKVIHRSKAVGQVSKAEINDRLRAVMATSKAAPTSAPVTFKEFAASWKVLVLPKYPKHSTRKGHGAVVDKKLIPYFGDMMLADITGEHVEQFITAMEQRGYSPHSVRDYKKVLSALLSKAKKWKRITANPALGATLPPLEPRNEQFVYTFDEAGRLLDRLPMRAKVAIHLAFFLRRGEVFAARWNVFDETARSLQVVQAVYDRVISTPKTKNSVRLVPLPIWTVKLLLEWRSKSKRTKPEDFILAGRMGVPGDHKRIMRDYIKPACAELKLKSATWLTFRRTWNTWADGKGISPKMRGTIVGNSAEVNSQTYTKTIPAELRNAVEIVGDELCANCAPQSNFVN